MSTNDEETFWVLEENDAFMARKVSGRNFRFKKRKGKGESTSKKGSHQRGGFFEKVALAGRPMWPMNIRIPTTRHIGEKAKERRERKETESSNIPMMETKVIHPTTICWRVEPADRDRFGDENRLGEAELDWIFNCCYGLYTPVACARRTTTPPSFTRTCVAD